MEQRGSHRGSVSLSLSPLEGCFSFYVLVMAEVGTGLFKVMGNSVQVLLMRNGFLLCLIKLPVAFYEWKRQENQTMQMK